MIAGEAGGRRLAVQAGRDTRPTSDRAREGLFATIVSMTGSLSGARVLDLYAGSGAVGLEALSRGAEHVLLVESGARAARVIRANIEAIGLPGAEVVTDRTERVLARRPDHGRYDVVEWNPEPLPFVGNLKRNVARSRHFGLEHQRAQSDRVARGQTIPQQGRPEREEDLAFVRRARIEAGGSNDRMIDEGAHP